MSNSEPIQNCLENEKNNLNHQSKSLRDESLPEFSNMQPYMYKPCISKASMKNTCPGKKSLDSEEDSSRLGNTLWCFCGKCRQIAIHAESVCCLDKNEIPESNLEGIN